MIKKVVIAGGGTAGWMTAAYLQASFGDQLSITVVESGAISTIGVGEATFRTIRHYFSSIGRAEQEWMPECNATYKLGIRFRNWRHDGHDFYHPFERPTTVDGYTLQEWWLRLRPSERFDRDTFTIAALCDNLRSPHLPDGRLFEADDETLAPGTRSTLADEDTQYPYAYHFDAALLFYFNDTPTTGRGVQRVVDSIEH